jgi:hypothetical protein
MSDNENIFQCRTFRGQWLDITFFQLIFLCFPKSILFATFFLALLPCCYCVSHPLRFYCFIINSCMYSRCAKTLKDLNHQHCNISGIWEWKIFCTTSHMMQPPVHDWKTELHYRGKQVPSHIWHHASHYVRHNSTFSCTYTLKDQRPDHYYSKFCNFTI